MLWNHFIAPQPCVPTEWAVQQSLPLDYKLTLYRSDCLLKIFFPKFDMVSFSV